MSSFVISIIVGRSYRIGKRTEVLPMETALSSASFNWSHEYEPSWVMEPFILDSRTKNYNKSILDTGAYYALNAIQDHKFYGLIAQYSKGDLKKLTGDDSHKTIISLDRGLIFSMTINPLLSPILREFGLNSKNAYGCILNSLFTPKPEIFDGMQKIVSRIVKRNSSTLMIGIHIRTGDKALLNSGLLASMSQPVQKQFKCAESLERHILATSKTYQHCLWYVRSDSRRLRLTARQRYGHKVVTLLSMQTEHTSKEKSMCSSNKYNCTVSIKGFQTAAAEWWLFGMMDYFIISSNTGFSKSAAMRSNKVKSIFMINDTSPGVCMPDTFTSVDQLAKQWSGL